eukprot:jgi/Chrzof1/5228/Cz15g18010.t1
MIKHTEQRLHGPTSTVTNYALPSHTSAATSGAGQWHERKCPCLLDCAPETLHSNIAALSKGLQLDNSTVKRMCYNQPRLLLSKPETIVSDVRNRQQVLEGTSNQWQPDFMTDVLKKFSAPSTQDPNTIAAKWQLLQQGAQGSPGLKSYSLFAVPGWLGRWMSSGWRRYAVLQYLADCTAEGLPHIQLPSMATVLTASRRDGLREDFARICTLQRHWPDLQQDCAVRPTGRNSAYQG